MTRIIPGSAPVPKVKKLAKIGLDLSCYVCGAKGDDLLDSPSNSPVVADNKSPCVVAQRALDGRIYFVCRRPKCLGAVV